MRGLLWYLGEADCANHKSATYAVRMKSYIAGLRKAWGQGDFPVYYAQVAPFDCFKHNDVSWQAVQMIFRLGSELGIGDRPEGQDYI